MTARADRYDLGGSFGESEPLALALLLGDPSSPTLYERIYKDLLDKGDVEVARRRRIEAQEEDDMSGGTSMQCMMMCGDFVHRLRLKHLEDEGAEVAGKFTNGELMVRKDFSQNKVCWHGAILKDLWLFTMNTNPIIALCYSHPVHPISRAERWFITLFHSLFIMMISSACPRAENCLQLGLSHCVSPAPGLGGKEASFCCWSQKLGLQWAIGNLSLGIGVGGSIYAMAANIVVGQIAYQLGAACFCCQHRRAQIRRFWEAMGHLLLVVLAILACIPMPAFISYNVKTHQVWEMLWTFLVGKVGSMLGTTIFQTAIFLCLWRLQCPKKADGLVLSLDLAPEGDDDNGMESFYITALHYIGFVRAQQQAYGGTG